MWGEVDFEVREIGKGSRKRCQGQEGGGIKRKDTRQRVQQGWGLEFSSSIVYTNFSEPHLMPVTQQTIESSVALECGEWEKGGKDVAGTEPA